MVTHARSLGLRQRQLKKKVNLKLYEERLEKWSRLAKQHGELAAIPSDFLKKLSDDSTLDPAISPDDLAKLSTGKVNPAAVLSAFDEGRRLQILARNEILRSEEVFKERMAYSVKHLLKPGMSICDVGCGPAQFAKYLIPFMRKLGGTYLALDMSPDMLDVAKDVLAKNNLLGPDVAFENGLAMDVHEIALEYGKFDLIVNGQNFIHIVDEDELRSTIDNECLALNSDGRIFVYAPFIDQNYCYERQPRKNLFTLIRYEKEVNQLFAEHHFEPEERSMFPYFDAELYTLILYKKTYECLLEED